MQSENFVDFTAPTPPLRYEDIAEAVARLRIPTESIIASTPLSSSHLVDALRYTYEYRPPLKPINPFKEVK